MLLFTHKATVFQGESYGRNQRRRKAGRGSRMHGVPGIKRDGGCRTGNENENRTGYEGA